MRKAGRLAAEVLDYITPLVVPGAVTEDLDRLCHEFITQNESVPAPLNYCPAGHYPFPKATCISINEVVCHGIPDATQLKNGDIVNIDVTVIVDGWYGDTSRTFCVGDVSIKRKRLVDVTYESMMAGIEAVKPGNTLGDIGHAIQSVAEGAHYSVVRDFCGHGLGRVFHSAPSVVHYGNPGEGIVLEPGMIFTIEPMINAGKWQIKTKQRADGTAEWPAVTKDREPSAQFEHSLGVTETGYEIFTLSPKGYTKPPYV